MMAFELQIVVAKARREAYRAKAAQKQHQAEGNKHLRRRLARQLRHLADQLEPRPALTKRDRRFS